MAGYKPDFGGNSEAVSDLTANCTNALFMVKSKIKGNFVITVQIRASKRFNIAATFLTL